MSLIASRGLCRLDCLAVLQKSSPLISRFFRSTSYLFNEGEEKLRKLLQDKLQPSYLHIRDISGGCGSMYEIVIDSAEFKGKRPIQQHRMVNEALGDEVKALHGLTIRIGNPEDTT